MQHTRVLFMIEMSIFAAIGLILSLPFLSIPLWLQGGSISFVMVPILIMAFRWGVKGGVVTGVLVGLLNSVIQPFIVHPLQYITDYPLAFALVGVAGLFASSIHRALHDRHTKQFMTILILATFLGSVLRFCSHFLGGIVFFDYLAPEDTSVWVYSLTYNLGYMFPSFLACAALLSFIIWKQPRLIRR
ncbi:energy-coupled thiamine transporter ThiT [Pontibacillus yanchengensis]|uniref:Energy-coupled thiamine transporter ThiT n=2 Tax=Pontibacillus yanchengensis TaxID=462910 RepID=A0ACC7VCN2_9BACI|nr:energy-coupled thiamine transporter ThiT [Pontibacillus yanchengensis]MYL35321.1 energy-coupled thiamine transporter ThiT [Pontibacillus yanchengensis]MYL52350.1 energy-coupled thiamine transporter ThiT [Pontibacillus yanchengensis]